MIFVDRADVDAWWEKIIIALEAGSLGQQAKVSTARPNSNSRDPSKHVICVYTYDSSDEMDVFRIRQALRDIGVTWKIGYKTDEATLAGQYQVRGYTRVTKFWE